MWWEFEQRNETGRPNDIMSITEAGEWQLNPEYHNWRNKQEQMGRSL